MSLMLNRIVARPVVRDDFMRDTYTTDNLGGIPPCSNRSAAHMRALPSPQNRVVAEHVLRSKLLLLYRNTPHPSVSH